MVKYCLRVEGVNFNDTLYDTNDLSVIRGSSLLLEGIGRYCSAAFRKNALEDIQEIYSGASHAGFHIGSDADVARNAKDILVRALAEPPYSYLSFVIDIGQGDSVDAALAAALRNNRIAQYRQWTIPDSSVDGALRQDALDGVRGATIKDEIKGMLSPSTKARLDYGRAHRTDFLFQDRPDRSLLGGVEFCQSFQDLVENPPAGLPRSVKNKIAVIHLDGDSFGKASCAVGSEAFARALEDMFPRIRQRIVDDALEAEKAESGGVSSLLRMEVLVWGGDDITIVVPAWRVFLFLEGFYDVIKDWIIDGNALGFTAGVVIAQAKTPIRALTSLAEEAVGKSKSIGARGSVTFDIFESVALPDAGQLQIHRERFSKGLAVPASMGFPGGEIAVLKNCLIKWKDGAGGPLPGRSQLYKLLQETSEEASVENFDNFCERVIPGAHLSEADLSLPNMEGSTRGVRQNLYWITQLWDYAIRLEGGEQS